MENKKESYIKIRISADKKSQFKEIAENLGITMSDILLNEIENKIAKENFKKNNTENLENRVIKMEKQIQVLKEKMEIKKFNKRW